MRLTARRLGATEIATFRDQVRLSPIPIAEAMQLDLDDRVPGATFHPAKSTLNLVPERVFGADLVRWVEARLREALGEPGEPGLSPDRPLRMVPGNDDEPVTNAPAAPTAT